MPPEIFLVRVKFDAETTTAGVGPKVLRAGEEVRVGIVGTESDDVRVGVSSEDCRVRVVIEAGTLGTPSRIFLVA